MRKLIYAWILVVISANTYAQSVSQVHTVSGQLYFTINGFHISSLAEGERVKIMGRPDFEWNDGDGYSFDSIPNGSYILRWFRYGSEDVFVPFELTESSPDTVWVNVETTTSSSCFLNQDSAKSAIENGHVYLFLIGGIAPVYITDTITQEKYHFHYYDFGCVPPPVDCILSYNITVFQYFDKVYGTAWRTEVQQEVIGLAEYLEALVPSNP